MYVIGTAGHVDHGKSTLVRALTGIDPDRLKEEKRRGMTIDLGFAWLTLPSGADLSIVDVPGHERFVKNMLAGVGGIDLALLVVAADEGVMPQTREHLAILDLLDVRNGLVALTKSDLVEPDWLSLVETEVSEALKVTTLAGSPVVAVSSTTRYGLDDLLTALDERLRRSPGRADLGRARMPIDRVFSVAGFGTVVTGTLIDGSLSVGDEVTVEPAGLRTKIRGLQSHNAQVDAIGPGNRVAANLSNLAVGDLGRGMVASRAGAVAPTTAIDGHLRALADNSGPLKHDATVTFHTGAAEAPARLRLLEADELPPGESAFCQIRLQQPTAMAPRDRFVLRANGITIGGGQVLVLDAKRHKRRDKRISARLATLLNGDPGETLLEELQPLQPIGRAALLRQSSVEEPSDVLTVLESNGDVVEIGGGLIAGRRWIDSVSGEATGHIEDCHRHMPLRPGLDREELRSRLKLSPKVFDHLVGYLAGEDLLVERASHVARPGFVATPSAEDRFIADRYLEELDRGRFSPDPSTVPDPEIIAFLERDGSLIRVAPDVAFSRRAYDEMVERVTARIGANGQITVAEVRDMFSNSRKYALGLMEYLDRIRLTRRVGDARVLRNR